ncbi:MAG: hypothetical protein NC548_10960 [Lachnospiraceae bacterium]|nr:hypothetical protein [Lachnospiraceae bacterium]MCM1233821.1 hypothetical protein [Ruminococcus flavefaciens]
MKKLPIIISVISVVFLAIAAGIFVYIGTDKEVNEVITVVEDNVQPSSTMKPTSAPTEVPNINVSEVVTQDAAEVVDAAEIPEWQRMPEGYEQPPSFIPDENNPEPPVVVVLDDYSVYPSTPTDIFQPDGYVVTDGIYFDPDGTFHSNEYIFDESNDTGWAPLEEHVFATVDDPNYNSVDRLRESIFTAVNDYLGRDISGGVYANFNYAIDAGEINFWAYIPDEHIMLRIYKLADSDEIDVSKVN